MVILCRTTLLVSLLAVTYAKAQTNRNISDTKYFEDLERHWSYERSPPVYPSRELNFICTYDWR
jgi:hypothetical protein